MVNSVLPNDFVHTKDSEPMPYQQENFCEDPADSSRLLWTKMVTWNWGFYLRFCRTVQQVVPALTPIDKKAEQFVCTFVKEVSWRQLDNKRRFASVCAAKHIKRVWILSPGYSSTVCVECIPWSVVTCRMGACHQWMELIPENTNWRMACQLVAATWSISKTVTTTD